jgi:8-oxo-dGTP pyrophosphatase MutT (NUDIX family)
MTHRTDPVSLDEAALAGYDPTPVDDATRRAAVVLPLVERADGLAVLFTERADDLSEHPGQFSFPGGGVEPVDDSPVETALRESEEEIGLAASEAGLIGTLDDVHTVTDYAVRPFVAAIPDRDYEADDYEVSAIAVVPVTDLLDPAEYAVETRDHPHLDRIAVHYFHVGSVTVWGATARMLVQFLELGFGWAPPGTPE